MNSGAPPSRILWAVDPATANMALHHRTARWLTQWCDGRNVVVEPVAVLSPDQLCLPVGLFPHVLGELRGVAAERVQALVSRTNVPGLIVPTILVSDDFSLRSSVGTLLEYARQAEASLLVVSSRSRRGVKRVVLGSFAETLILRSELPVLVVTPQTQERASLRHIHFATDFSDKSHRVFRDVLALAKSRKARLTLYHKLETSSDAWTPLVEGTVLQRQWSRKESARQRASLQGLVAQARRAGVKATGVLDRSGGAVSDGIIASARRRKSDLVVLASESGPTATALLGSVARQVLRASPLPTWVVHP